MSHQEHKQIRFRENLLKRVELDSGVIVEVGFTCEHVKASNKQLSGNKQSRGFAQVVDVRLKSQAQTADTSSAAELIF